MEKEAAEAHLLFVCVCGVYMVDGRLVVYTPVQKANAANPHLKCLRRPLPALPVIARRREQRGRERVEDLGEQRAWEAVRLLCVFVMCFCVWFLCDCFVCGCRGGV